MFGFIRVLNLNLNCDAQQEQHNKYEQIFVHHDDISVLDGHQYLEPGTKVSFIRGYRKNGTRYHTF